MTIVVVRWHSRLSPIYKFFKGYILTSVSSLNLKQLHHAIVGLNQRPLQDLFLFRPAYNHRDYDVRLPNAISNKRLQIMLIVVYFNCFKLGSNYRAEISDCLGFIEYAFVIIFSKSL